MSKTIVDLAIADDNFSTLVAAVTAAGLVDALNGDGPLTCVGKFTPISNIAPPPCPLTLYSLKFRPISLPP